ncbi:MAG: TusE/DsrC/DsvC family sulfur relay protein [Bacteroidetes bacterium]|nr:TusE/DsrC/DsvC family sulfur relay protein [Bacteroidota bacterium]MDA1120293.1 TusE/DsrC/DsvC family sulfur relay protein [Bacteroidota bacterium]
MGQLTLAGKSIDVNDEGYFTDSSQWDEEIAVEIARQLNIQLTHDHFSVIHYLRERFEEGVPLTIRRVSKSGVCDIKTFYQLFPGGPLKISSIMPLTLKK